jgi:hypothetical protein
MVGRELLMERGGVWVRSPYFETLRSLRHQLCKIIIPLIHSRFFSPINAAIQTPLSLIQCGQPAEPPKYELVGSRSGCFTLRGWSDCHRPGFSRIIRLRSQTAASSALKAASDILRSYFWIHASAGDWAPTIPLRICEKSTV